MKTDKWEYLMSHMKKYFLPSEEDSVPGYTNLVGSVTSAPLACSEDNIANGTCCNGATVGFRPRIQNDWNFFSNIQKYGFSG